MKLNKLFLVVMILLLIPLAFADSDNDNQDEPAPDYSSSEYVNDLKPEDLAAAIQQGKISDMSIVNDDTLAGAIQSNPSISKGLDDKDLSRAINKDISLLDDSAIMKEVDSRAQSDISILNENPDILEKWFAEKNIEVEGGAQLESYDGNIVTTAGRLSTSFNINDHPGAIVGRDGGLILAGGAYISNAEITKGADGTINVNGGFTELDNAQNANIKVYDGVVTKGIDAYQSTDDTPFQVTVDDGSYTITGINIEQYNSQTELTTAMFSGEVTFFEEGYRILGANTELTTYIRGRPSNTFMVDKPTEHTPRPCVFQKSCIKDLTTSLGAMSEGGNTIFMKSLDESLESILIDEITDDSTVIFNKKDRVELTVTKDPVTVKGDISDFNTQIEAPDFYLEDVDETVSQFISPFTERNIFQRTGDFFMNRFIKPVMGAVEVTEYDPFTPPVDIDPDAPWLGTQEEPTRPIFGVEEPTPLPIKGVRLRGSPRWVPDVMVTINSNTQAVAIGWTW